MITEAQKNQLKKVLKYGYPKQIQRNLKKRKILNNRGNPFSINFILSVMKGEYSNHKVEEEIFKLYQVKKEERRVIMQRRNEILGIKE
jgi:hypothetical protein